MGATGVLATHSLAVDELDLPAELLGQIPPDLDGDRLWLEVCGDSPLIDGYRPRIRCHGTSRWPIERGWVPALAKDRTSGCSKGAFR